MIQERLECKRLNPLRSKERCPKDEEREKAGIWRVAQWRWGGGESQRSPRQG